LVDIKSFQEKLNLTFENLSLLKQALTHASYINENPNSEIADNERMEFLGDSLLNFIIADLLYYYFPNWSEGRLTEIRISFIRQDKLAEKAMGLNLGEYLLLGKGEEMGGGRSRLNNLANAFEALIAAIYLDRGIEVTRNFIKYCFQKEIQDIQNGHPLINYKAWLQEITQARFKCLPDYETIEAVGPDHDKVFFVSVSIGDIVLAVGSGKNKKTAQVEAAHSAYNKLMEHPELFNMRNSE